MKAYGITELSNLYTKRALATSLILHIALLALSFEIPKPELKLRDDAIEVTMVPPATPIVTPKEKKLLIESPLKVSEKIKVKPKEKVVTGTKVVVPKAKELGNPNAKKVQDVQKGDPLSKKYTAYKPDTEFRKTPTTNIGTGGTSNIPSAKIGGGSGDTYKGPDFATKSLTENAMKGARFAVKNAADDFGAGAGKDGGIGDGQGAGFGKGVITGSRNGTIEKARMLDNVGSLTGATVGKIDSSKGAEGLSAKGTVILAGVPEETVVLGSMDPNLIRQKLLEHLVQFRYCYQSELDNQKSKNFSGIVLLNFSIGRQGEVQKMRIGGDNSVTPKIKSCVGDVLQGITFPTPRGGGLVEVKQPMNFYPKSY